MTDELLNALEDCLAAMLAGESLEASLTRHPALADDLRPLLEAAQHLNTDISVPRAAQNASRAQFLARAAELRSPAPRPTGWASFFKPRWLVSTLALMLVVVFGANSVVTVSAQSLPGEALYGVKRVVEQTQLAFTTDSSARAQLQERLAERRIEEAHAVLALGRVTHLEFSGVIDELNGEQWTVAGLTVEVPAEASVVGVPFAGLFVEVSGESQSTGVVRASALHITGRVFRGRVASIGAAQWRIDEQSVLMNAQTQIDPAIELGDEVDVYARTLADGQVLALQIRLVEKQTPPTATATLIASPTPRPSAPAPITATPTLTTVTPNHTPASTSGPTLTLTRTRLPTHTPTFTMTPADTPTDTPIATLTRTPLPTNPPPATPTPESPATPTHAPEPTQTQEPHEVEFDGVVTAINGNSWTIGEHQVTVTGQTEFEGNPSVGSHVDVNAWQFPDGMLIARRIRVR